jgi:ribosomal protein L11 methylase PrmA
MGQAAPVSLVWDFGANDGRYSRLALEQGAYVVAFDIDPAAVSRNYLETRRTGSAMLPLLLDLGCPSPAIGFGNRERKTIGQRQKPGIILMLAVIHHLAISNNLPLQAIAEWLSGLCAYLIIEFVPKEDSQVQVLLKTRADIFTGYTTEGFEAAFSQYFLLCEKTPVAQSNRTLYLFKKLA